MFPVFFFWKGNSPVFVEEGVQGRREESKEGEKQIFGVPESDRLDVIEAKR